MEKIIFVTGNKTKILHANEAVRKMGYEVTGMKLEIIEPRSEDPEEVVVEKAVQAFTILKKPLIVEDSGIFILALKGFPKTFVHFALDTLGIANILKMMEGVKDRSVEFRQSLAYIEPGMEHPVVFSYVDGGFTLADKIWNEFDESAAEFDKVLIPPGEEKPLCTFTSEWRAKRDVNQNNGAIHYQQLAGWLKEKGINENK